MAFYLQGIEVFPGTRAQDQFGDVWVCKRTEPTSYAGTWPFLFTRDRDKTQWWFDKDGNVNSNSAGVRLAPLNEKPPKVPPLKTPTELELEALKVRMGKLETLKGFEAEVKKLTAALKEARVKTIALKAELYKGKKGK